MPGRSTKALQPATTEMLAWLASDDGLDAAAASHLLGQVVRTDVANVSARPTRGVPGGEAVVGVRGQSANDAYVQERGGIRFANPNNGLNAA